MDYMQLLIFKATLNLLSKKHETITDDDSPIKMYPNKKKTGLSLK